MSAFVDIVFHDSWPGVWIYYRQSMQPWVLFMCWCMPPLYYHFLLLSVHYLCNLIQAISGLLLHVVMICKGEPPSGSFLRSMGKLGLDWIGSRLTHRSLIRAWWWLDPAQTCKGAHKCECVSRESNPGLHPGRVVFYHLTSGTYRTLIWALK